ncbi:hypothetical protein T4E_5651, partial [Trichinella pseudospiralis]
NNKKKGEQRNRLNHLLEQASDNGCNKSHGSRQPIALYKPNQQPTYTIDNHRDLSDDQVSLYCILSIGPQIFFQSGLFLCRAWNKCCLIYPATIY